MDAIGMKFIWRNNGACGQVYILHIYHFVYTFFKKFKIFKLFPNLNLLPNLTTSD